MAATGIINVAIGSYLDPELIERIAAADENVRVHYRPDLLPVPRYACVHSAPARDLSPEQLDEWRRIAAQADVFYDFDWHDPASMPERCTNLKWIQATSAGIGGVMQRTGIDQSSIVATTAAGVHGVPLAEFAVMGALYFVKGVAHLNAWKHDHHWQRYTTRQLKGMHALVVGLGGIGREMVRQFAALGVEVTGLGRAGRSYSVAGLTRVIDRSELDAVLATTDILILSSPLTKETNGMIGEKQIALLPREAVLINVSRGQLVDQGALTKALSDGMLAGACLDVFAEEPLPESDPLWSVDNVIISPHSASTVRTENRDIVELFVENLGHFRRGEAMKNLYDPLAGY